MWHQRVPSLTICVVIYHMSFLFISIVFIRLLYLKQIILYTICILYHLALLNSVLFLTLFVSKGIDHYNLFMESTLFIYDYKIIK